MNQTLRLGTFETNSSSTHNCVICSDKDYNLWKSGELYYCYDKFYTKEEVLKEYEESDSFGYNGLLKNTPTFTDPDTGEKGYIVYGTKYDEAGFKEYWEDTKDDDFYDFLRDSGYQSFENFGEEYESDHNECIIDGVKVHVLCEYGYGG